MAVSGAAGVSVAVAPLTAIVPTTLVAAPAAVKVKVVVVNDPAVILELNVADAGVFTERPVAAAAGVVEITCGAPAVVKLQV